MLKIKTISSLYWIVPFDAGNGYMQNFKICGEKLSENYSTFHRQTTEMNLCLDQIYNADEKRYYFLNLKGRTLVSMNDGSAVFLNNSFLNSLKNTLFILYEFAYKSHSSSRQ